MFLSLTLFSLPFFYVFLLLVMKYYLKQEQVILSCAAILLSSNTIKITIRVLCVNLIYFQMIIRLLYLLMHFPCAICCCCCCCSVFCLVPLVLRILLLKYFIRFCLSHSLLLSSLRRIDFLSFVHFITFNVWCIVRFQTKAHTIKIV